MLREIKRIARDSRKVILDATSVQDHPHRSLLFESARFYRMKASGTKRPQFASWHGSCIFRTSEWGIARVAKLCGLIPTFSSFGGARVPAARAPILFAFARSVASSRRHLYTK